MSISKRHRENREAVDSEARYELSQAISMLQNSKKTKFEESIDIASDSSYLASLSTAALVSLCLFEILILHSKFTLLPAPYFSRCQRLY
jgi:hypothetical protein